MHELASPFKTKRKKKKKKVHASLKTHLLALQSVQSPHSSGVQLDGVCDVSEHLVEGVRRLLIEQYPHRLAGLDAAADDGDELGFDEVLGLALQLVLQRDEGGEGARRAGLAAHRPVGVDVLGVVHPSEGFIRGADVTLAWRKKLVGRIRSGQYDIYIVIMI